MHHANLTLPRITLGMIVLTLRMHSPGLRDVREIASGANHCLALLADATAYSWGIGKPMIWFIDLIALFERMHVSCFSSSCDMCRRVGPAGTQGDVRVEGGG